MASESSQHTALPWHHGPYYKGDIESSVGRVAECGLVRGPQGEIDAAFIVRACNSHDELLAALRAILHEPYGCVFCDSGTLRNPAKPHMDDCGFAVAKAAIAKAEGHRG